MSTRKEAEAETPMKKKLWSWFSTEKSLLRLAATQKTSPTTTATTQPPSKTVVDQVPIPDPMILEMVKVMERAMVRVMVTPAVK